MEVPMKRTTLNILQETLHSQFRTKKTIHVSGNFQLLFPTTAVNKIPAVILHGKWPPYVNKVTNYYSESTLAYGDFHREGLLQSVLYYRLMLPPYLVIKIFILPQWFIVCTLLLFIIYKHYPSGLHCVWGKFSDSRVFLQYTEIAVTSAVMYNYY